MFLNLSNHPSTTWPPPQLADAVGIGGEIRDEPFPDVHPEATADEVMEIGAALVARIVALEPTAAMVQGEFTLTFYLVHHLETRGIACYAATTRRVAEIAVRPGDTVEKKSRFEFVRFRRYSLEAPGAYRSLT